MAITTSWAHGVSGDFNTAGNWTNGVPTAGETTLITAAGTYTVSVDSADNSIGKLSTAKDATLAISDGYELDVTAGGTFAGTITVSGTGSMLGLGTAATDTTFDNSGLIDLDATSGTPDYIEIAGTVTLSGKGQIEMAGMTAQDAGIGDTSPATLINETTIYGNGTVGSADTTVENDSLINADSGVGIDVVGESVTNSGLMEATAAFVELTLDTVVQTSTGVTQTTTANAEIDLQGSITGGALSLAKGSYLVVPDVPTVAIDTGRPIINAGTIETEGGSIDIESAVQNTTTGVLAAAGGQTITVSGAVTKGSADIYDTSSIVFDGASSANVVFEAGSTNDALVLAAPTKFTGTVAGMSADPDAVIWLSTIPFADDPTVSFNATTHMLTVTDPVKHITARIKIVGTGTFTKSEASDGGTLISDPPAGGASAPTINTQLLVQSMASFNTSSSAGTSGPSTTADLHSPTNFLASPHTG